MDVTVTPVPKPPPQRITLELSEDEVLVLSSLVFDRNASGAFAWLDDVERSEFRQDNPFIYELAKLRDDILKGRL
jgi:hypothetical protein